jgi:hypothetical protein
MSRVYLLVIALMALRNKLMSIPTKIAQDILKGYRTPRIENLFAQSNASFVLYEVGEDESNFPRFDPALTDKVTMSAYSILAAGVSIAEAELTQEGIEAMEQAGSLLINVHLPHIHNEPTSGFHVLVAAMAFYSSGQYSRAFVSLKEVESNTDLAAMVSMYIKKQPVELLHEINPYILVDLSSYTDPWVLCDHAVTISIARALSHVLEYFSTGSETQLVDAERLINVAIQLALDYESPAHWWIARLLRLMIRGNGEASLWRLLPPYFSGDDSLLSQYVRLLLYSKFPVTELWRSQRDAIKVALNRENAGAVVNMRTSSGKTRVAELAILQALQADTKAKILYLAPFRSLALEIEQTLGQVFEWCGFRVSHLYGGFRLSTADRQLAEDSSITIATPEKARAILRSSPDLFSDLKLIVIDEGHLIGANERYVKNELFIDHLRHFALAKDCRMIMLSAVLPNPNQLAEWITGDSSNVIRSNWKPSVERFGLLLWREDHVRVEWRGDFDSFNPRFVTSKPLGWGRRRKPFPNDKNEAIAASAVRLTSIGPVMIFSARANSIPGLAKAVLLALGEHPEEYAWPETVWRTFQVTCEEELPADAIELKAARYGVLCHSNRLPAQVRMATERLMRSTPPKIIIASSTLAQGVNIGISSVIVATPYKGKESIDHRDFWNICGRAGRAFVDGEGKILYAIDETRERWRIKKDHKLAKRYFRVHESDPVESGLLFILNRMCRIAQNVGVNFDRLVTMVAENDFSDLGEEKAELFAWTLDLIDDSILSIQEDSEINLNDDAPEEWIDRVFRGSLAAIQADNEPHSLNKDEVIQFVTVRARQIMDSIPDVDQRRAYISTGLPISSAKSIYRDREMFLEQAQHVANAEKSEESIVTFLKWIEAWARDNAVSVFENIPEQDIMDSIRSNWIAGTPMSSILEQVDDANWICKDIYGYQFPWLIHAASMQIKQMGDQDLADILSLIALLTEIGVPNDVAAWVFLSGVRSRAASTELSQCGIPLGSSLEEVRWKLREENVVEDIRRNVSSATQAWIDLHWSTTRGSMVDIPMIPPFSRDDFPDSERIVARTFDGNTYLCSTDGRQRSIVDVSDEWPFDRVADDHRYCFEKKDELFHLVSRDPKCRIDRRT